MSARSSLFVTGASGFVGTRLLALLDPAAHGDVTLLSRQGMAVPARLAGRVNVVPADLRDTPAYAAQIAPGATVLHMAALTGRGTRREHFLVNDAGTAALLDAAAQRGAGRFVFLSSIACGFTRRAGYHYADAKASAERRVAASGLPWTTLRATIVLGPAGAIWSALAAMASKRVILVPGSGRIRIQPIWVDDLARVLVNELAQPQFDDEIVDVGGPEPIPFDDFLRRASRRLRGSPAALIHVPAAPIVAALRAIEAVAGGRLPVSAGQFASFRNDGVARPDPRLAELQRRMAGVDTILERLTGGGAGAAGRSLPGAVA